MTEPMKHLTGHTTALRHKRLLPAEALHIVGLGASAGGLEAMLQLFAQVRPCGQQVYVVAQHMAKGGHDELVVRLMNRESALPVVLAGHADKLMADTVYVIPSGRNGVVKDGAIWLQPPLPTSLSTPSVNVLFHSIAEAAKRQAVGIVLSGTGADGSLGCQAIQAQGGLTLAQLPADAKFDSMPCAAIAAKVIDEVLSASAMGARLVADRFATIVDRPDSRVPVTYPVIGPSPVVSSGVAMTRPTELAQLLTRVHEITGIDFSDYKEETLLRRLHKRMATLGVTSLADYLALTCQQPDEIATLQQLFLVSVSSFFRDRASFDALRRALAITLAGKPVGEPVRVWVPGCASGEEALTLAIVLHELTDLHPIEIMGTDLNPQALALARAGRYRPGAFKEMDAGVRLRHFSPHGPDYQASPELLACIRYEQRDVLGHQAMPPLDLVSCRNLLIYMKVGLQDKLITLFYRALHTQGLLFIGQSEALNFVGNALFTPVDYYHSVYKRRH